MSKLLAFVVALMVSTPAQAGTPPLTAKGLLARIDRDGSHEVIWDLWGHQAQFGQVLDGIESADPAWLRVATALRPFADGGASLSLNYAAAHALPKAPNRVLALVDHGFDLDDICTSPFIEPEPGVAERYERRTLAALSKVRSPALTAVAVECAKRVRLPAGA